MTIQPVGKKILSMFLGFMKDKVDNDELSLEEFDALVNAVQKDLKLMGTPNDFARHFHRSPVAVRSVICRRMLSKPNRKVMYDFKEFADIAPDSWKDTVTRK